MKTKLLNFLERLYGFGFGGGLILIFEYIFKFQYLFSYSNDPLFRDDPYYKVDPIWLWAGGSLILVGLIGILGSLITKKNWQLAIILQGICLICVIADFTISFSKGVKSNFWFSFLGLSFGPMYWCLIGIVATLVYGLRQKPSLTKQPQN